MNPLERSLIEKAGYANGWENVRASTPELVAMFSARHKAEAHVGKAVAPGGPWRVTFPKSSLSAELSRSLPATQTPDGSFEVAGEAALGRLLRRAAELAMSLPTHAADLYAEEVAKIVALPPAATEALRLVKQRVGQNIYRQALMEYWGGACAVTGLNLPEALRASHAKPWAKCDTDAERLDVFNGFLLSANLDALFDAGLMTFSDDGTAVFSSRLTPDQQSVLGLSGTERMKLRWISPAHLHYLAWHRNSLFQP
jgi:hypothetical protein